MLYHLGIIQNVTSILPSRKTKFWALVLCAFLFSLGLQSNAAESASPMFPSMSDCVDQDASPPADVSSIDAIVGALYEAITFPKGEKPDMDRLRSLFTPNAAFVRIRQDGLDKMDLGSFMASFMERVNTSALISFYEAEICRKTHAFGSIAQVFSTYKKRMNSEDPEACIRGINSLQLYHDGQRWWISSITWEEESSDNPIPEEYLKVRN